MKFFLMFVNKTPLHVAVENGNKEIIRLLLAQNGIEVDACDEIFNCVYIHQVLNVNFMIF